MKKLLLIAFLFASLIGCHTEDQTNHSKNPQTSDLCAEKSCSPGYICSEGECKLIDGKELTNQLVKCDPECPQTQSCVDGVCVDNNVSTLCGGKKCQHNEVCDDGACRAKRGCEIASCTPDKKCHKGTCLPVDSCIFSGCPHDQECVDNSCVSRP